MIANIVRSQCGTSAAGTIAKPEPSTNTMIMFSYDAIPVAAQNANRTNEL